jgi:hypothetical protein
MRAMHRGHHLRVTTPSEPNAGAAKPSRQSLSYQIETSLLVVAKPIRNAAVGTTARSGAKTCQTQTPKWRPLSDLLGPSRASTALQCQHHQGCERLLGQPQILVLLCGSRARGTRSFSARVSAPSELAAQKGTHAQPLAYFWRAALAVVPPVGRRPVCCIGSDADRGCPVKVVTPKRDSIHISAAMADTVYRV